jgi:hypothetical protein
MISNIAFIESPASPPQILQLYEQLELYSAGDPPQHTLFVAGRPPLAVVAKVQTQLLLIDPPADTRQRFRLPERVAVLFTGAPNSSELPQIQTSPGGIAHLRIGDHLLDIYSQRASNVVHLPALGILCGGAFGSDTALPHLAPASDGDEELDTLRLLARLVKARRLQLYIPAMGTLADDPTEVLRRLASDVAYLHNLRRVIPELVRRGDDLATRQPVIESLLPADRRSAHYQHTHQANVQALAAAHSGA